MQAKTNRVCVQALPGVKRQYTDYKDISGAENGCAHRPELYYKFEISSQLVTLTIRHTVALQCNTKELYSRSLVIREIKRIIWNICGLEKVSCKAQNPISKRRKGEESYTRRRCHSLIFTEVMPRPDMYYLHVDKIFWISVSSSSKKWWNEWIYYTCSWALERCEVLLIKVNFERALKNGCCSSKINETTKAWNFL